MPVIDSWEAGKYAPGLTERIRSALGANGAHRKFLDEQYRIYRLKTTKEKLDFLEMEMEKKIDSDVLGKRLDKVPQEIADKFDSPENSLIGAECLWALYNPIISNREIWEF
jgi:hypothetical protein